MKLTIQTARQTARDLGYTLRRSGFGGSEFVAYRKGTGENAAHAYYSDDLADALATVRAMAQDDAANRLALGRPATRAAWAEVAAQDAERAAVAAVSPFDANRLAGEAEGRAVAFLEQGRPDLAAGSFRLAAALFGRSVAAFCGRGPRAYQESRAARAAREAEASDAMPFDLSDLTPACADCGDISGEGIAPCASCGRPLCDPDPIPSEPARAVAPLALSAVPFAARRSRAWAALDELDSLGLDLLDPWAGAFDSSYGFGPSAREGFAQ